MGVTKWAAQACTIPGGPKGRNIDGGRGREGKEGRESIHNTYIYIPH
jgi:hypothetical protein